MIRRILLAVDDSPSALAAARLAVTLAAACGAALRAVTVVPDGTLDERLSAGRDGPLDGQAGRDGPAAMTARRARAARFLLRYVSARADREGVPCDGVQVEGEIAARVLEQARDWPADLIVVGRSDPRGTGQPYIGGHARHVLEFAEQPVLVVPYRRDGPVRTPR
jgi:nucleotide-binding universal stress UspA family protein